MMLIWVLVLGVELRSQTIQALYDDARKDFLAGNFGSARQKFQRILQRTRKHHLSDNAQFWIGESYMAEAAKYDSLGDTVKAKVTYEIAIASLREVFNFKDTRTPKYADALYEISNALLRLGRVKEAYKEAVYLLAFYPDNPIAPKARALIIRIKEKEKEIGKSLEPTHIPDTISTPRDTSTRDSTK